MNLNAWWASLRIARRDALRHKARSALVITMLGLPIVGVVAADVLTHSAKLSAAERVDRQLGSADALVHVVSPNQRVDQSVDGSRWTTPAADVPVDPTAITVADIRARLPAGSQLVPVDDAQSVMVRKAGGPVSYAQGVELDYPNPVAGGLFRTVDGRAPRSPDEIAITTALAAQTRTAIGDTLVIRMQVPGTNNASTTHTYHLVATVAKRYSAGALAAVALPGALSHASADDTSILGRQYYVKSPDPITWADVLRLNKIGITVVARSTTEHPPPRSQLSYNESHDPGRIINPTTATTVGVVIVMCLLEIVLLAGPAFAVGARGQRRQLGIVAASGGEPRHTRSVVLGGGVILGLVGGLVGAGLGLATGLVIRSWRISTGSDFGGLHFHGWEIAGIALVSLLTGVLAAILPARAAAKQDVVGALAGRRPDIKIRKRTPILGILTTAAGIGLTWYGAVRNVGSPSLAIGAAVGEIGLVACIPALVGLVGRLARYLPLASRLALRDSTRNRGRSAPAVAAIMAAVAGSITAGIYMTSADVANRRSYTPELRPGLAAVTGLDDSATPMQPQSYAVALEGVLPLRSAAVVARPDCNGPTCVHYQALRPASQICEEPSGQWTAADVQRWRTDPRCAPQLDGPYFGDLVIGGPDLLQAIVGHDDPAAAGVLTAGGAVTFDSRLLDHGKITIAGQSQDDPNLPPIAQVTVPGVLVHAAVAPAVLLSTTAADALGAHYRVSALLLDMTRTPTRTEEGRANDVLARVGEQQSLYVERGYHARTDNEVLLFLVIAAGLVTFGAAGAATGLAIADARPDHVTLAAIGAAPATRRRLAMATAGIIALLGALLGTVTGFVPAIGLLYQQHNLNARASASEVLGPGGISVNLGRHSPVIVAIPWLWITAVLLAVPALAALFAAVFTRSQRVLARRIV
jgi:putative ABC transport system permease protein